MSSFKDFDRSNALLRIFLILYQLKKSNPTMLAKKLKITPTGVVNQLKFLESKKYIKSAQEGRLQIYEPNIKVVTNDCLRLQEYYLTNILPLIPKSEIGEKDRQYFQKDYIKKVFLHIKQNAQIIKLMDSWFKNFSYWNGFKSKRLRAGTKSNFKQIFVDEIPKEFTIHYTNFRNYDISKDVWNYFHLLNIFQIEMARAGKVAFEEIFKRETKSVKKSKQN